MSLICYLTKIHFADGILEYALAAEIERFGVERPLVVTDPGIVEAGLFERLQHTVAPRTKVALFDGTPENPTEAAAVAAAKLYRQDGCDCVVGLGGGSSLDLAKAVAILVTHGDSLVSYAAVEGGIARIKDILPPLIAIPTTAGTGSEVGGGALIVLDDGRKVGLLSPYLIPKVAICDPTLTIGLPPALTAGTGMDALSHCVETYISTAYNPPADGIALDGLRRAAAHIERAVDAGSDLEARREMMAAAMNGALAFQKGLGGVHAISHALGSLSGYQLHHGTLNAVLLPYILEFNAPAVGHRYAALKQAMVLPEHADLAEEIFNLNARIGMPSRLGEMGLDRSAIEAAAPLAEKDHTNGTNPRKARAEDYHGIMSAAL
ncbi:MAG: iron-containing alcohol dehydrogenase [Methyloligellaceae bacterium]